MTDTDSTRTITLTYTQTYYSTTYTVTSSGASCPTSPSKRDAAAPQLPHVRSPWSPPHAKRAGGKPACLASYKSADVLSSACSCISIKTSTTTVVTTSTTTTYKVSRTTTDKTTTKTLIPAPTCSVLAANSSYDVTEYYAGCGFQRPVNGVSSILQPGLKITSDPSRKPAAYLLRHTKHQPTCALRSRTAPMLRPIISRIQRKTLSTLS